MKELIKSALLTLTFYSCTVTKSPSEKCSEFRSGKYIFNMYNESALGHWKKLTFFITRNDSLEHVTSTHFSNDTSIFRITWTGVCEYRELLLNPKNDIDSFLIERYPSGTSNTIIKAKNDYFIVRHDAYIKDTIWKIK
jgi:hypothetical protein